MINDIEAENECYKLFNTALNAQTIVTNPLPTVYWPNVEAEGKPNGALYHIRPRFDVIDTTLAGFCDGYDGGPTVKKYKSEGIFSISIYCPSSVANSAHKGKLLAKALREPFRHQQNEVWFRNARIQVGYQEDRFWRVNMIVEFYYMEVE